EDIMSVDRTYIAENDAERGRLRALVARLSDADLARPMPAGWTVAAILAHLAFWDQRILVLLEQWERSPSKPPRIENEADTDWINDASKPLLLALAPRQAAELAVAIAETVDGKVAALPDDLVARNAAAGSPLNLLRAEHRAEHLREIEHLFR
ncbi:MAG TPA: maleylpyruvate isomerase N-terminal domain-containing protein, partial [Methylomirabilota bacterium]|nr:maleylpyruvate isomerase N-terminal domain-containing protein [Methylomirabilota bacterium]